MKKVDTKQIMMFVDIFIDQIQPWCQENKLSLHEAFELSREKDLEKYKVLKGLWCTYFGREYLRSAFRSSGGRLRSENHKRDSRGAGRF